jgi:hypothetical protein
MAPGYGNRAASFLMLDRSTSIDSLFFSCIEPNMCVCFFILYNFFRLIEAVNDCDDALKLDSSLIKLHLRKATALFRLGHLTSADEAYTRVLEYNVSDFSKMTSDLSGLRSASDLELRSNLEQLLSKVSLL